MRTSPYRSEPTLEEIRQGWHALGGCDWQYAFPRLYAIALEREDDETGDLADRMERERRRAELQQLLEEGHREALEVAKDRPPWD